MINIKKIFVLHTFVLFLCASLLPVAYADPLSKNQEKILCFEDRVDQGDQDTNDAIVSFEQSVKFKSYDCQDLSGNVSGKDVQKSDGRTKRIPQYVPDGRNDGKITLTGKAQDEKATIDESINPNEDRNSEVVQERAKRPADAQARTACRAAGDKSDAGCRTEVNKGIRTRDESGRARAEMAEGGTVLIHGQDGTRERERIRANKGIRTRDEAGRARAEMTGGGTVLIHGQDGTRERERIKANTDIRTFDGEGSDTFVITEGGDVRLRGQDVNSEEVEQRWAIRPADAKAPQSNSKKDSNDKSIVNLVRPQKQGTKKPGTKKPACSLHDSVHC